MDAGSSSEDAFLVYRLTHLPQIPEQSLRHVLSDACHAGHHKIAYYDVKEKDTGSGANEIRETCIAIMKPAVMRELRRTSGCFANALKVRHPGPDMNLRRFFIPLNKIYDLCPNVCEYQIKDRIKNRMHCLLSGGIVVEYPKKYRIFVYLNRKPRYAEILFTADLPETTYAAIYTWLQEQYWEIPGLPPHYKIFVRYARKRKHKECIQ